MSTDIPARISRSSSTAAPRAAARARAWCIGWSGGGAAPPGRTFWPRAWRARGRGPRGAPARTGHHVAWGTTVEEHPRWLEQLARHGVHSTPVVDRHFFKSIYFREPGGVLYEIADDGPGFGRDEELGRSILLPPWLESQRESIE